MSDLSEFEVAPEDGELKEVSGMVSEILEMRLQIEVLTKSLKDLSADERELSQNLLPEKMREIGLNDFTMEDGTKIAILHKVKASLSAAKKQEGFAWLRDNGFGDLIKSRVVEESVHSGTLSAFCKEQLALGKPLPTSLFGVYEFDQTNIKQP